MSVVTSAGGPESSAAAERPLDVPIPTPGRSTRHRLNGLDGYRALAVTVVCLYHFKTPGFSGGWIGPELFFVLSGYLITTLLLDRSEGERRLSLLDFWHRRIKRLYPAVILLVAGLVVAVALLAGLRNPAVVGVSPNALSSESFACLFYYANWHLIAERVGYFGQSTSLLKHTWSLAIEEQFYVVFPLVFVLVRRSRRWWRPIGFGVAVIGLTGSVLYAALSTSSASLNDVYYSTQTNAYHLLTGVALAFGTHGWSPTPKTRRRLDLLAVPALAVVALFVEIASGSSGQPHLWMLRWGELILDLGAATLLVSLVFGARRSLVSRFFNIPIVVWIGSISYGIYLWHYPLAVLLTPVDTHLSQGALIPLLSILTIALAAFSYYFLEVNIRETLISPRGLRWMLYAAGVIGAIVVVGCAPQLIKAV